MCICLLIGILFSCTNQKETIYVDRDGVLYEVADQVSFYYPKTFSIDISRENTDIVQFTRDQEVITYSMRVDNSDNLITDMPHLYEGELETMGAKEIAFHKKTLDSGNECYMFSGYYGATGIKFKHIVFFSIEETYIYAYQAPKDIYDDHIQTITHYLETLTIHYEI